MREKNTLSFSGLRLYGQRMYALVSSIYWYIVQVRTHLVL